MAFSWCWPKNAFEHCHKRVFAAFRSLRHASSGRHNNFIWFLAAFLHSQDGMLWQKGSQLWILYGLLQTVESVCRLSQKHRKFAVIFVIFVRESCQNAPKYFKAVLWGFQLTPEHICIYIYTYLFIWFRLVWLCILLLTFHYALKIAHPVSRHGIWGLQFCVFCQHTS